MSWERVVEKFHWLAEPFCDDALRANIVAARVDHVDQIPVAELAGLLGAASRIARRPAAGCGLSCPARPLAWFAARIE